jgi:predicted nucleic acid-binding Zn ribbon protein
MDIGRGPADEPRTGEVATSSHEDGYVQGLRYALDQLAESDDFPDLKQRLQRRLQRFVGGGRPSTTIGRAAEAVTEGEGPSRRPDRIEPLAEGHCWRIRAHVDVGRGVAVFLDERGSLRRKDVLGSYEPLAQPDLLRRFTTVDFSRGAEVEGFYEEFGPLTFPAAWKGPNCLPFDGFRLHGEPIRWLQKEAAELRLLLDLHGALQEGDSRRRLRRLRHILAGIPRREWLGHSRPFDTDEDRIALPETFELPGGESVTSIEQLSSSECQELARDVLKECIDWRLRGLRRGVGVVPVSRSGRGNRGSSTRALVPRWTFSCLRDALYLRLYDIVTHDERVRLCRACGHAFPTDTGRGRPREHCDDTCRYLINKRQQRARIAATALPATR